MLLDDLTGLEFEATMTTVFKKHDDYHNVRQTPKTGDKGRDVIMRETVNDHERAVIVECKHKAQVSRGEIQKLHSAVVSFGEYPGPKRGMFVTSGRFSPQAKEHAEHLRENVDGTAIELVDGRQLIEIGETLGMNLHNGHFNLPGDQTLPPVDPTGDIETPIGEQLDAIANFDAHERPVSESTIRFQPVVSIQTLTDSVCTTPSNNRVLDQFSERDEFLIDGTKTPPTSIDDSLRELLTSETPQMVPVADWRDTAVVTDTTNERFVQSETEYKEWAVKQLQSKYTDTKTYTGKNNQDYTEECVPDESEISITELTAIRVPRVRSQIRLQEYDYILEYDAVGAKRHTIENELAHCVHCGWSWLRLTYCGNCGAIACWRHTKTERLDGEPICTGCAVTARFGLRKRYFSDAANRDTFHETYNAMAPAQKVLENWPWITSALLILIGLIVIFIVVLVP